MIVDELGKALATVLKFDGPADVLMSRFFRLNHKLGSRDRSIIAEAIFFTLRHLSTITWQMKPAVPVRAPKLTAMVALSRIYGREALSDSIVGPDAPALDNILRSKPENATPFVQSELPYWLYERLLYQFGDEVNSITISTVSKVYIIQDSVICSVSVSAKMHLQLDSVSNTSVKFYTHPLKMSLMQLLINVKLLHGQGHGPVRYQQTEIE